MTLTIVVIKKLGFWGGVIINIKNVYYSVQNTNMSYPLQKQ